MGIAELRAKLEAGDETIVPRDATYVNAFFGHLAAKYPATA